MATKEEKKKYPDWWYQPQHQEEMNALAGQITSRPAFKFKVNQEALYDYYKGEHDRQGRLDRLDTEAKGAGLTGGFDNSYATQAGQQAYENQIGKLRLEVAPELRQAALKKYTQEGNALVGQYEQLQEQEENAYKQWQKDHKDEIKEWEGMDAAEQFIAMHPELDSYRNHTGGYYQFAVEKALREENLTRAEFEKLMKYYGISFGNADVSHAMSGKDADEMVSYDMFQQELEAATPAGKATAATDRILGNTMGYDPMAAHLNQGSKMYASQHIGFPKTKEQQAAEEAATKALKDAADAEFTKAMENNGYSVSYRHLAVNKLKEMGAHDSYIQGVLTEEAWNKLRDQAVKAYESGSGTMNLAGIAYDSYSEYLRAYLTMADYCDVTVAATPGEASGDGRYESTGNAMFDAFTAEYITRFAEDNGYAARFKAQASSDTYNKQAEQAEAYARELAYWEKRAAEISSMGMSGHRIPDREQAILAWIVKTYGENISDKRAKAELTAKLSRRLAVKMDAELGSKYADDFAKKSVYDSGVTNDLYKDVNGGKKHMEPEEIAVFNYLYSTEGYSRAKQYYDSLVDLRNSREGQGMADDVNGNYLKQLGIKAKAGFNQFTSGLESVFKKTEAKDPSALQYASEAVDEDLADVDLKWFNFADGKLKDQKIFGRSLGQLGGDLVQTTTNMVPSIATSLGVGLFSKSAGTAIGLGLMGASSAGNAYQEMLNQGYSQGSASCYGILVGSSEVVLGKVLGGISKLGGGTLTKKAVEGLAKMDNALSRFAKSAKGKLLMKASSEAIEEGLQSILEPYIKSAVTGEEFTADMEETLYSALMGFISGGMFEGTDMGITSLAKATKSLMTGGKHSLSSNKTGKVDANIQNNSQTGIEAQEKNNPANLAPTVPVQPKPQPEMQEQPSADMDENIQPSGAVQQAVPKVEEEWEDLPTFERSPESEADRAMWEELEKEDAPGEKVLGPWVAQALENYRQQGELTVGSMLMVLNDGKSLQKLTELTGIEIPDGDTAESRAAVQEAVALLAEQPMENFQDKNLYQRSSGDFLDSWGDLVSKNTGTDKIAQSQIPKANQAAQVATPKATTPNSRGTESPATVAKTAVSPLKAASKKYGAQAAMMENAYQEGQDVERFDREYKLAYDMGKEGASRELMDGGAFAYLTAEQKNTAYQSGAAAAENAGIVAEAVKSLGITGESAGVLERSFNANQITARNYAMGLQEAYEAGKTGIPLAEAGSHAAKLTDAQRQIAYKQGQKAHGNQVAREQAQARKNRSDKGADTSKGKVHFDGDRAKLNKIQRASLNGLEVLAKILGVQIYVENFEGTENANKNGWYDPKDGSIHININAGAGSKGTMLFTVAHELTHFIRQWSPAKFEVLANFLTKQYGEQGVPVSDLIDAQIADAKADNRDLTRDEAFEEVVADSMESMLADGSIIEMMAELRQQDRSLWQKICDWFKDLAGKIQAVVDAYKGVEPDSTEGRMVADMKDIIGTLEALYMDALVDASENFDAGAQKITTADSGGVKYSLRAFEDGTRFVDVQMDPSVFDGMTVAQMNQKAKKILMEKFAGRVIGIENRVFINGDSVNEYLHPSKSIDLDTRKAKLTASGELDNLLDAGVALPNEPDGKDGHVHPDAIDFSYYKTIFKVGAEYFEGIVNIKNIKRGKLFKDVTKIRNITKDIVSSYGQNPKSNFLRDASMNSIRNPDEVVNKKISNRDSAGNQLSEGQQEYFKDSKERDDQGRLRVMYRGDSTEVTVFDRKKSSYSNLYGRGFYFTNSASHAGQYGQATAYYLNITNPVSTTDCTITKEQMRKFLEAVAENEDDYGFENYGYGATVESVLKSVFTGKSDFAMLYDVSQTAIGDMVEAVELFNKINGTAFDGLILDTETVVFDSAQAKRTDNSNPTANPDTRYSQRDVGRQEAVTQALEKENGKLKEDVAELRELVKLQRQVTNGTKFTKTSVEAAARYLKQNANSKGSTQELSKLLNGLYEYIASTKELTWEGVKEQAQGAVDWLWEHIDRKGKRSDYAQEILTQLHGTRVRLDESQMAEAEYRFGSYNEFRKRLMGSITLANDANTSLDSLWAEFSELYPDVFDGEITAADMPGALADIIERLRTPEATALDYARDREMMEQDLLRQVYDSYWRVSTLYTPADVGARRINKLKMEHYQRMDKLRQQHRETLDQMKQAHQARLEQVRMEHRAKLEERTEQITKKYQEVRKQNVEGRKKTEQRQKIRKTIRELSKLLTHGTKERNVKEGMKDFVSTAIASAEVLFTDEYTNEDMIRNGVECECAGWESSLIDKTRALIRQRDELLAAATAGTEIEDVIAGDLTGYEQRMNLVSRLDGKISENMGKLKDVFARERSRLNKATASSLLNSLAEEYWKLGTADEEYIRGALDENVHQHLMNLSKEIGGTTVKDMSLSQLEQLHRAYTMVLTTVRNANKSFAQNLKGSRMEQAKAVTGELAEAGKKRKKQTKGQIARAKRSWNNLKSVYAFERIGSGTLKQLYENLRGGEDAWMVDMDHAREHFLKAARDTGYNGWDLNKQTYSFESSTGLEFDLNLGQIMSIYAYARRGEQALDHLMKGGFVFDKYAEERVTEHGIPKTYLKDDATAYNLSLQTIQEIIGKLTPEQKAFVEAMQDYLSDTMGSKGNEVSMKLYGVKLFGEKFYFPLRSSGVYLSKAADQEQQKQQGQVSVKNAGFTHSTTPNAANPVVLSGFMDVWANHVNDMSMYHAFVLPMEDFNKVYHYSTPHTEESQSGAVKQAIINAHGSAATDYINQLIRDLNGGVVTDPREGQYKAWISKFKKASVMASASVVIQQPTAIVRALAYIDPKYFGAFSIGRGIGRALGNKVTHSHTKLYDELKKYAPVAAIKQMGRFDTDMGKGAVDYLTTKEFEGFKEKTKAIFKEKGYLGRRMDETMGFMAERADEITWLQIWQAVKKEVAHKQKLKVGSQEHLQAAGKRFTEVITKTQVYDSVFSRSANMRSKGAFMTMATSFMAEPTTTANMLMDAIRKARQGDVKHFLRVGASVAGTIIFNNILRSAVYAGRDDDEDETYLEKYLQALAGGMLDDVNFMNYLPFWRDVWSLMQGYDVERSDMSVIGTLIDAGRSLADALAKDTDGMTEEELEAHNEKVKNLGWKFVDGLASAVGLPEKNLRRDIMGAVNFFGTIKADGNRKTTAGSLKDKVWEDFVSSMPGVNIMVDTDSKTDNLYDAIVAGDAAYVERLRSGYQTEQSYLQAKRRGLKENDLRIKTAAEARIAGNMETYMNLAEEIIAEGYFTQDDVVVAINAVINELTPNSGSSTSASKAKGLFDANAFATAISQGDAEMAKTIQVDIIRTAQLNGKTEEEAQKSFISSATSACKEMFGEGELTEDQAVDALVRFCGKERNEARASVAYWEFIMEHPDTGASAGWFETYYNKVEKSGVAIEDYVEYRNRKTGYTKRAEVLAVIDAMDLTKVQKDALYRAEGYAESTLDEAPWH